MSTRKKTDRALKIQGNKAEKGVADILYSLGSAYHVFNNVMLKTGKGTTQIDHVVVSRYGIFVIETKSHKGTIFGDCNSKMWTQVLFTKEGQKNYPFYSPYLQNYGHLRNLYKLFNLSYMYFLGIICFTNDSVDLSRVQCQNAIKAEQLRFIISSHTQVLFTDSQVAELCSMLKSGNIQSKYYDKKHVSYVKSLQGGKR